MKGHHSVLVTENITCNHSKNVTFRVRASVCTVCTNKKKKPQSQDWIKLVTTENITIPRETEDKLQFLYTEMKFEKQIRLTTAQRDWSFYFIEITRIEGLFLSTNKTVTKKERPEKHGLEKYFLNCLSTRQIKNQHCPDIILKLLSNQWQNNPVTKLSFCIILTHSWSLCFYVCNFRLTLPSVLLLRISPRFIVANSVTTNAHAILQFWWFKFMREKFAHIATRGVTIVHASWQINISKK